MTALNFEPSRDPRGAARSNMFLAAVLHGPDGAVPVKVRNMSATGALIEGATVPSLETAVRLVRGSLAISCVVAWSAEGRCGLHFSSLACVRDWLAPAANRDQQRVDEMVSLLKLGAVPLPQRPKIEAHCPADARSAILGADLHRVSRLIEKLGDELAADAAVLASHAGALQNVDIAVQTLAAIGHALAGASDEQAIASRLESLRASCTQALKAASFRK